MQFARGWVIKEQLGDVESRLALGAGAGFLLARVMHFDIGLGLVLGALAGVAGAILLPREEREDDAAPRD